MKVCKLANKISFKLFGKAVVEDEKVSNISISTYFQLAKGNVFIDKFENVYVADILAILNLAEEYIIRKEDLVKTFYYNLEDVLNKSELELFFDQIFHYMTTYGTDFQMKMFHQNPLLDKKEIKDVTDKIVFIPSMTESEFREELVSILKSPIALSNDLIEDIFSYISVAFLEIDLKDIQNKDFLRYYKINKKIIENIEDIITAINYETTGNFYNVKASNLFCKNESFISLPKYIGKYIKHLKEDELKKYAKSFNRNKKVWITIKKFFNDKKISKKINRISKLSKKLHQPKIALNFQRVSELSLNEFSTTISKLDFGNLLKIGKYLKTKQLALIDKKEEFPLIVRVRNGKSFITFSKTKNVDFLFGKFELLKVEIKKRLTSFLIKNNISLQNNGGVDLALPINEKQFVGNFPFGTKLKIEEENLFVGISWVGNEIDFDLSAVSLKNKIGWNGNYRNSDLFFSGDITSAPNGATELIFTRELNDEYVINVNLFRGKNSKNNFKFFIGNADLRNNSDFKKSIEDIVDVEKIRFNYPFSLTEQEREMKIGFLNEEGFYFTNFNSNKNVSSSLENELEAFKYYTRGFLTFTDIFSEDEIEEINKKVKTEKTLDFKNPEKQLLLQIIKEV